MSRGPIQHNLNCAIFRMGNIRSWCDCGAEPGYYMTEEDDQPPRWMATIHYRFNEGIRGIVIGFEEFTDLGQVIEQGPHWDSVVNITVERLRDADPTMTVEKGAEL